MESPHKQGAERLVLAPSPEAREMAINQSSRVVSRIAQWAKDNDIDISNIEKLGGGFVNLVLLIQTSTGKEYVAKNFMHQDEADVSRKAQKMIERISDEDSTFIPEVVSWIDDDILISEKAEGLPILQTLRDLKSEKSGVSDAHEAFFSAGHLIGLLHERTQSHSGSVAETGEVDTKKITTELEDSDLIAYANPTLDAQTITEAIDMVRRLTDYKHVSVIHGDTHLNQFFYAPDNSLVTIVDYDSVRIGDPMFDVARMTASLRVWCQKIGLNHDVEMELTQGLINGYRKARERGSIFVENEFSYSRVLAYEMKLYLVQLKALLKRSPRKDSMEYINTAKSISDCIQYLSKVTQQA